MFLDRAILAIARLFARQLKDQSGNTLAMIAAALVPLLAMVGGGVDMGRSYLSQTRLQQACDAGVLAARKKLGSEFITTGVIPADVADAGNRFFNLNFANGSYGTENRSFQMTLEDDFSISGAASVDVPTTIMTIFGYSNVDVAVECEAKLNFSNTDIMFVLDTTGSMTRTNPDDTEPRINVLRQVVKDFHAQVEGTKSPGTRVRYGFLPYSTNVHVAPLLKSDWMVDKWTYQSRTPNTPTVDTASYYTVNYTVLTGSISDIAPYTASSCPDSTRTTSYGPTTTISTSPHEYWYDMFSNGNDYWCTGNDGSYTVYGKSYNNYSVRNHWKYSHDGEYYSYDYHYAPVEHDVTPLKGASGDDAPIYGSVPAYLEGNYTSSEPSYWSIWNNGCIEERDTYEIDDYDNVDLSRALDLDIDLVPTPGDPRTQWRPMLPEMVFEREIYWDFSGSFNVSPKDFGGYYINAEWADAAACPSPARKLAEMDAGEVSSYVDSLDPKGDTYHDIGMIWGARMLSPTGIFAADNADVDGKPTSRHLIFLTDGQTEAVPFDYGAYGVEPLDRRRWRSDAESGSTLNEVVEQRFGVACAEAKKRNITIWVIGFGTTLNPIMTECAGPGHYFEATNASTLSEVFAKIAAQLGDLRISK